jgi:hypothetical protein
MHLEKIVDAMKRKEILNKMFPYNKPNCLTEGQYNYLNAFYSRKLIL